MSWVEPVFAVVAALLFGGLLVGAIGWRHPRRPQPGPSLLLAFLLLFPVIWAAAIWLVPMGPPVLGTTLLPALVAGLLIALVIAMFTGPSPRSTGSTPGESAEAAAAVGAFGLVFWLLMVMAAGAIVTGYLYSTP